MSHRACHLILTSALCACAGGNWRADYPAPYNTATTEEQAHEWRRSDEIFKDRTDWASQPIVPESLRVRPRFVIQGLPLIPDSLRRQQGRVTVGYMVEPDGNVRDVRVLFSTNSRLDESCRAWVRTIVYTPGTDDGRPSIWRFGGTCNFAAGRVTLE